MFFWFYSILAGWSTWQWVLLNFSLNFWSFDTPDTTGCASAVIWNHCLKQIWAIPPTVGLITAKDISALDISSHGLFGTRTFQNENILAWVYFGTINVSAQGRYGTGTFWHKGILTYGRFGTCTFWRCAKQYRHFGILVPKCPSAVMSPCRNIHGAEKYPCGNVLVPKCPCAENSLW